jgi:diguanylate cyclase (GGDEF)-like protein
LGADAYFEKPVAPDVLKAAISARLFRSLEQEKSVRQDGLTGLPNRAALGENFRRLQNLAERRQEPQALALLNFDKLKPLNEIYGHVTGDTALRHAVKIMLFALRKSDLLCRLEGDTFVLLLPHTTLDGARNAVGKALFLLRNEPFRAPDGHPILLSVSAGVVQVPAGASLDETLSEADRWLYLAKAGGRGRLMTPQDSVAPTGRQVLLMEPDENLAATIEQALRREGFDVLSFSAGEDAAFAARESAISLCIADFRPGSRDGQELLRSLRNSAVSRPPVLMLTSTGSDEAVALGYQLGADDYLVKPFTGYELMSRVHSLLRQ